MKRIDTTDAELVGTAIGVLETHRSLNDIRDAITMLRGAFVLYDTEPARFAAIQVMKQRRGRRVV